MTEPSGLGIPHLTDERPIGRGGFSVVYAATDNRFDRQVAVKLLNALTEDRDRRRFDTECRVMGRVSGHPNVVTVHDADFLPDDRPYLIMEYIKGGSLADRLEQGPVPWPEACRLMVDVSSALAHAHDAEVLHRDIKPANILLDEAAGGRPMLTDFGIASMGGSTVSQTSTQISATWLHTAPETFNNQRDVRSDIYSMASTLYHLIAGHAPHYRAEDTQIEPLLARLLMQPTPPLPAGLAPAPIDAFLARNLSKDPNDRSQSAGEFGRELKALVGSSVANPGHTTQSVAPMAPVTPPPPQPDARSGQPVGPTTDPTVPLTGTSATAAASPVPPQSPASPSHAPPSQVPPPAAPRPPAQAAPAALSGADAAMPGAVQPPPGPAIPSVGGPRSTFAPPAEMPPAPKADGPKKRPLLLAAVAGLVLLGVIGIGGILALTRGDDGGPQATADDGTDDLEIDVDITRGSSGEGDDQTSSTTTTSPPSTTTTSPTVTAVPEAGVNVAGQVPGVALESACVVPQAVPAAQPAAAEDSLDSRSCARHQALFSGTGDIHEYVLAFDAGAISTIEADTECTDVSLMLTGPLGEQFVELDLTCSSQTTTFTAPRAGEYRLRLEALEEDSQYSMTLLDVTNPSAQEPGQAVESNCPSPVVVPDQVPVGATRSFDENDCPAVEGVIPIVGQTHRISIALEAGARVDLSVRSSCNIEISVVGPRGLMAQPDPNCLTGVDLLVAPIAGDYHIDLTADGSDLDYEVKIFESAPEDEN